MGEGPSERSVGRDPRRGPGAEPLSRGFSAARRGTIKSNFTDAPQAGEERFLCLFQIIKRRGRVSRQVYFQPSVRQLCESDPSSLREGTQDQPFA